MRFVVHKSFPSEAVSSFADLKLPREKGLFIAEGEKIVERLLKSELNVKSLYLTEEHFEAKKQFLESHQQASEADIFIASKKSMEKIVGFTLHQGILAAAEIPEEQLLENLIDTSENQLFVLLDTIADAENIGTLYRTALAMGATAVLINDQCVSPWMRRAVRVSMGATFRLPTITTDLVRAIVLLRDQGVSVFASQIGDKVDAIWKTDFTGSTAIVFGSEGYGITPEVINVCEGKVMIPMQDGYGSFNVGVAQGIILYEVMRQRTIGK